MDKAFEILFFKVITLFALCAELNRNYSSKRNLSIQIVYSQHSSVPESEQRCKQDLRRAELQAESLGVQT